MSSCWTASGSHVDSVAAGGSNTSAISIFCNFDLTVTAATYSGHLLRGWWAATSPPIELWPARRSPSKSASSKIRRPAASLLLDGTVEGGEWRDHCRRRCRRRSPSTATASSPARREGEARRDLRRRKLRRQSRSSQQRDGRHRVRGRRAPTATSSARTSPSFRSSPTSAWTPPT